MVMPASTWVCGSRRIFTNRTLRKATLEKEGHGYLSSLIQENLSDLLTILKTNEENDVRFFRISSEIFPFYSHPVMGYEIEDLPESKEILSLLSQIGKFATEHGHRLTTHTGPFNVLASPSEAVVMKTILDLECHSKMFDYMGFVPSHYNKKLTFMLAVLMAIRNRLSLVSAKTLLVFLLPVKSV